MNNSRLIICGADDVANHRRHRITHMVSIANPGAQIVKTDWFKGEHLVLHFGDVVSEADAFQCKTQAPTLETVRKGVEFIIQAWRMETSNVLVQCDYGASRSPSLAYVALAKELGPGHDDQAFQTMLKIQPNAVPNILVVQLGDVLLERHGALIRPLAKMYDALNEEINKLLNSVTR
jgi:predicted protein tyrosine phosphatase